jgi:hypothetical protein
MLVLVQSHHELEVVQLSAWRAVILFFDKRGAVTWQVCLLGRIKK